ncbi:MAG: GGDEF domain-containing protein [Paracoccaceae bacterium]
MFRKIELDAGDTADETGGISERALKFARTYGTPLTPEVYHVWYTYATRENEAVNGTIDTAMNTGAPLTASWLTDVYMQQISPRAVTDDLSDLSDQMNNTMGELNGSIETGLNDNSTFTGALRSIRRTLAASANRQDLSSAITRLLKANQRHLVSAQRMEVELRKNRTKLSKLEKELAGVRRNSSLDHLTQIPNRRRFDELLDEAIFNARQKNLPLTLAAADLDSFREINDKWGNSAGDTILRQFASVMIRNIKGKDSAARISGEEFALLLADVPPKIGLHVVGNIRAAYRDIHWTSKRTGEAIGSLTVSFGLTELREGDSREGFIHRAEQCLIRAKSLGRDQTYCG